MSQIQRLVMALLPRVWAESIRAESQSWKLRCECGYARSIWELGGIRWKARGHPRRYMRCPSCGQPCWHSMVQE